MDAELTKLRQCGYGSSVIAKLMNDAFGTTLTRNSVIGRACRLKLPDMSSSKVRPRKPAPPNAFGMPLRKRSKKPRSEGMPREWAKSVAPLPEPQEEDVPTKTFSDLEWGDGCCRHRIDVPFRGEPYGFCGKETVPGLSVCRQHAARWFTNWADIEPRYVKVEEKQMEDA